MRIFAKGELKLLWPFYFDALISTILFFAPAFFIVYFRELNFSLFQVGLLLAVPGVMALLFDIPAGAFADLHGRKVSVLVGIFLQAIALGLLYFFTSFFAIAIIFAFMGLASTLVSGASTAWTTDLIYHRNKKLLTGYFAKSDSIASLGMVFSGLLGAFLVKEIGIKIIWPAAALSLFISIIILSFGKEIFVSKKTNFSQSIKEIKKQTFRSISFSWNSKIIFSLILAAILISFAYAPLELGFVPLLQNLGLSDYTFGYFWSAMAAVGVVAPLISQKVLKHGKERKFIITTTTISILFTLAIVFADTLTIAISAVIALIFSFDMRHPIILAYFQKFVPSKLRATVSSVKNMALAATGIIAIPLAGYVIDIVGAKMTIFYAGFIAIPAAIIYYMIKDPYEHDKYQKHRRGEEIYKEIRKADYREIARHHIRQKTHRIRRLRHTSFP